MIINYIIYYNIILLSKKNASTKTFIMCVKAHTIICNHKHDFLHASHRLFTVHKMLITSNITLHLDIIKI